MSSSVGRHQRVDDVGGQHLGPRRSSSRSSIWRDRVVADERRRGSPASPSSPISSGGIDRICQNDASADSPRMRSCQALASVRPSTCSGTRTSAGQSSASSPRSRLGAARRPRPACVRSAAPGCVVRTPGVAGARRGAAGQDGAHPPSVHAGPRRGRRSAATCRTASPRGGALSGPTASGSTATRARRRRRGGGAVGRRAPAPAAATQRMIGLGGVAGVEVLAPDLRAGLQVPEDPGDGDVEARGRRPGACSRRRRPSPGPRAPGSWCAVAADRLDLVALGAVEGDGDRARRPAVSM